MKSESISVNPTLLFSKCVSLGTLTFVCLVFLYMPKFARIKTWLTGIQVPSTRSTFSVLPGVSSNNQKQQGIALTFLQIRTMKTIFNCKEGQTSERVKIKGYLRAEKLFSGIENPMF